MAALDHTLMSIEVELKFRVADVSSLERQLAALGFERPQTVEQADVYYAHPGRDFARTDEALRVRQVGEHNYFTYKGPKLDAATKTRREIEIALSDGSTVLSDAGQFLQALGFKPVAEVRKTRRHGAVAWQGRQVEVSLDWVEPLGDFVELEIVAGQAETAAARDCILALANELGLHDTERRSYLELLLEARK